MVDIGMNSVSKILGITQTPMDIKAKVIEIYYNHSLAAEASNIYREN